MYYLYLNIVKLPPLRYVDDSKIYLKCKASELSDAIAAEHSDLKVICRWRCQNSLNQNTTRLLVIRVPKLWILQLLIAVNRYRQQLQQRTLKRS